MVCQKYDGFAVAFYLIIQEVNKGVVLDIEKY